MHEEIFKDMRTSEKGLELIKHYESLHDGDLSRVGLQPKMDPSGYWTEGWGHLMLHDGQPLKGEENKDIAYSISIIKNNKAAEDVLKSDLRDVEDFINALHIDLDQNQFDSIVSFCYNVGVFAFLKSTLLKRIKGEIMFDDNLIRDEFLKWKYSSGKELRGLYLRRKSEAKLYIEKELKFYN